MLLAQAGPTIPSEPPPLGCVARVEVVDPPATQVPPFHTLPAAQAQSPCNVRTMLLAQAGPATPSEPPPLGGVARDVAVPPATQFVPFHTVPAAQPQAPAEFRT